MKNENQLMEVITMKTVTKTRFVKNQYGDLKVEEYEKNVYDDDNPPHFYGHKKPEEKIYYCPFCHLSLPTDRKSPCECWTCRTEEETKKMWELVIYADQHQSLVERANNERKYLERQMIKYNRYF